MPSMAELAGEGKPEEGPPYQTVSGAMDCQFCFETVHDGRYFPNERVLLYKCSLGHVNKIEDFD